MTPRCLLRAAPAALVLLLVGCGKDGGSSPPPEIARTEPGAPAGVSGSGQGAALYKQYCMPCHGPEGKGNGPAAAMLPVKPADHTNAAVMSKISDADLFKAIKEGGPAVGKSVAMPPWGGSLEDEQIRALVAYVRSLAKPR